MKLRQEHVKTFKAQIQQLNQEIPRVIELCDKWLREQEWRTKYGYYASDQDTVQHYRIRLEGRLTKFRLSLGEIYDFMSEKGLREMDDEH
jgi:hypothetical protein